MKNVIEGIQFVKNYQNHVQYRIPNILHLTYTRIEDVPDKVFDNWAKFNPYIKTVFYDDRACLYFLNMYFGWKYAYYFTKIPSGAIKADLFRACLLYVYGGIYCDIDLEPYVSFDQILDTNTSFCTCLALNKKSIFQAFIASTPKNIILKECIKIFTNIYITKPYDYWGWSGTTVTYQALQEIIQEPIVANNTYTVRYEQIMILEEYTPTGHWFDSRVRFFNIDLLKSRYDDYPEWSRKLNKFEKLRKKAGKWHDFIWSVIMQILRSKLKSEITFPENNKK